MASPMFTSRQVFARDLVSVTDAELDLYLEEHRLEDGAPDIDLEDPENLLDIFNQRLRQQASSPPSSRALSLTTNRD